MSEWQRCKAIARAILHDRAERRKVTGRVLFATLLMMAAGLWLVDGWLARNPLAFLAWWVGVMLGTLGTMLLAVYDALAVIREERDKHR
jgi:hypothetical protein